MQLQLMRDANSFLNSASRLIVSYLCRLDELVRLAVLREVLMGLRSRRRGCYRRGHRGRRRGCMMASGKRAPLRQMQVHDAERPPPVLLHILLAVAELDLDAVVVELHIL